MGEFHVNHLISNYLQNGGQHVPPAALSIDSTGVS